MSNVDRFIGAVDKFLRAMTNVSHAERTSPAAAVETPVLNGEDARRSAGLMRVNHVGEVCAQALYDAQSQFARSNQIRTQLIDAGREEQDHLAWTSERLAQLNSRPSLLNPLWYGGAYTFGVVAAMAGDKASLGFVVETERQVEAHLGTHLERLPLTDHKSRAIVQQMRADEREHGERAHQLGAVELPQAVKIMMRGAAFVMKKVAYHI